MSGTPVVDPARWYATLPMPALAGEVDNDMTVLLRSYRSTHAMMEGRVPSRGVGTAPVPERG